MLENIRKASEGVVGKAVMTVLMGLIIVSFAIWGVGDMFRGTVSNKAATVGDQVITSDQFRAAFERQKQQYSQMLKQPLTSQMALQMGVDKGVLNRLESEAALDSRASALGLSLSDAQIAEMVQTDPSFTDASGKFNRLNFDELLRQNGLSEVGFLAQQRATYIRAQIERAITDDPAAPKALSEVLAKVDGQTRSIDTITLAPSAVGDPAAPSDDALAKFFEAHKASYRANELRTLTIVEASPEALAKPNEISDEDAKAFYEKNKVTTFTQNASRHLDQLTFVTDAEAAAALAELAAGKTFDDLVKERKLTPVDVDLGVVTKKSPLDKIILDAAFALAAGKPSDVVKGPFGPVILRASAIVDERTKPYDEVAADIKKQLAIKAAGDDVSVLHDKIEDLRVTGKNLVDAAKAVGLDVTTFEGVDFSGNDKSGAPVVIPGGPQVIKAAFASDVAADDPPISLKGGAQVWFDVTKIEPAHDRTLVEAKDKVLADYKSDAIGKALTDKAADLVKQIKGGVDIAKLATDLGVEKKSAVGVKRSGGVGLGAALVSAIFQTGPEGVGSAADAGGRVIFKVTADKLPDVDFASADMVKATKALGQGLSSDILAQYVDAAKKQLGVTVDQDIVNRSVGP